MSKKKSIFPKIYLSAIAVAIAGIFLYRFTFPIQNITWYYSMLNSVSVWMISIPIIVPVIHWMIQPRTKVHLKKLWRSFWK